MIVREKLTAKRIIVDFHYKDLHNTLMENMIPQLIVNSAMQLIGHLFYQLIGYPLNCGSLVDLKLNIYFLNL